MGWRFYDSSGEMKVTGAVTSVFGRTGVVTAESGDYTAAQVTNSADKSSGSQQSFTGELKAPDLAVAGLTGASAASRYVGATTSGAPSSGTFAVGDFAIDQTGKVWICTTAGTPGTWAQVGGGSTITSYRKSTAKVVNTTTTETDLLNGEITLAANDLTATGHLRFTAFGDVLNNAVRSSMPRFKLVVGSVTIFDTGVWADYNLTTIRYPWRIVVDIAGANATNAQVATMFMSAAHNAGAASEGMSSAFTTGEGILSTSSVGTQAYAYGGGIAYNSVSFDATTAQAFKLTATNPSASAAYEVKLSHALVEII